jgi:hypothetical protein
MKELFDAFIEREPHPTAKRWKAWMKDMEAKGHYKSEGGMLTSKTPLDEDVSSNFGSGTLNGS